MRVAGRSLGASGSGLASMPTEVKSEEPGALERGVSESCDELQREDFGGAASLAKASARRLD